MVQGYARAVVITTSVRRLVLPSKLKVFDDWKVNTKYHDRYRWFYVPQLRCGL